MLHCSCMIMQSVAQWRWNNKAELQAEVEHAQVDTEVMGWKEYKYIVVLILSRRALFKNQSYKEFLKKTT